MRQFALILFAVFLSSFAFPQKMSIEGVTFDLPENWIGDPFSSSSVCDCPGVIIIADRYESTSVWIAIYPIAKGEEVLPDHNAVWSYAFQPESNSPDILTIGKVNMNVDKGTYTSSDGESYPGYKITSEKGRTNRNYDHIVHIYSNNAIDLDEGEVATFLQSIKWK